MIYKNPLAKYSCAESGNMTKAQRYEFDVAARALAFNQYGVGFFLSDFRMDEVEYIAGVWRLQSDFPYQISRVRDRDFVIGEHLNRHEQNGFEYYSAKSVSYNCYGPFVLDGSEIVACFNAGVEPLCAYGPSIEHARAFLAIALFDRNREMIFAAERARAQAVRGK